MLQRSLSYLSFLFVFCVSCQKKINKEKGVETSPNIVFVLVDDLGYSDVAYTGHKLNLNTPNIDKLAKSGMVFTNAYAAAPVCSPTRASILTGKSPAALKITCHIPGRDKAGYLALQNEGRLLHEASFLDQLPLNEVTIAETLQENGYNTGFFGKWHLAGSGSAFSNSNGVVAPQFHPEHQGFDINVGGCAYGQPDSWFAPYNNATIPEKEEGQYLTDRLGDEAVTFITENQNNPFFLYLSTYTVHTPLKAPEEALNNNNGNTYFAMIEKLDENVGRVIAELEQTGILENTLVIFYSDNGGLWGNKPLKGDKGSLHEGGIRVPLIVSWKGKIKAGQTNDSPVTSVDFFPTLMDFANIQHKSNKELEGESLMPLLMNNTKLEDRALYWHFPHYRNKGLSMGAAIREGDWKLIWEFESDTLHLYNLKKDVGETNNLASSNTSIVEKLLTKLKNWQKEVDAEMPSKT